MNKLLRWRTTNDGELMRDALSGMVVPARRYENGRFLFKREHFDSVSILVKVSYKDLSHIQYDDVAKYWPEIVNYFGASYICNLMAGKTAELVGNVIPLNGFPKHDKNLYQTHTIVKKTDGVDYTAELVYIRQVTSYNQLYVLNHL